MGLQIRRRRPSVPLQQGHSECGYNCIAAVLATYGEPHSLEQIKALVGRTTRGLTLSQLRAGLERFGVVAQALAFSTQEGHSIPAPCIAILKGGHYIFVQSINKGKAHVFLPESGWESVSIKYLNRRVSGLALKIIDGKRVAQASPNSTGDSGDPLVKYVISLFANRSGLIALGWILMGELAVLCVPILSGIAVNSMTAAGLSSQVIQAPSYLFAGFVFLAITIASASTTIFGAITQSKLTRRLAVTLARATYSHLSSLGRHWDKEASTVALNQRIAMLERRAAVLMQVPAGLLSAGLAVIVGACALFFISIWLVIPGLISTIATICIDFFMNRRLRALSFRSHMVANRRQEFMLDALPSISSVKSAGGSSGLLRQFVREARASAAAQAMYEQGAARFKAIGFSLKSAEQFVFLSITSYFVTRDTYSLGAFVAIAAYKDHLARGLLMVFRTFQNVADEQVYVAETRELMQATRLSDLDGEEQSCQLFIEEASFAYSPFDRPVLCGVNFKASDDELIVLRGRSGVGKSTFLRLIAGDLSPTLGKVRVNGRDPTVSLSRVQCVWQSERLIVGSIRKNICLYRDHVSDDEITEAVRLVGLIELVNSLPMRLETRISEESHGISGGQRQRIILARAILKRPGMLILDEATSQLDVYSEQEVISSLRTLKIPILLCSHRPEVWSLADRLIEVSSSGTIVHVEAGYRDKASSLEVV